MRRTRAGRLGCRHKQPSRSVKLSAVIGEDTLDLERARFGQRLQKSCGRARCLVGLDRHERPTRGVVDGDEKVAAACLVGHWRQVLDVDMQKQGYRP